jgi:hypothetical protein
MTLMPLAKAREVEPPSQVRSPRALAVEPVIGAIIGA